MTLSDIVRSIDALPPLSNVAQEVQKIYSNAEGEIDVAKLTQVVESDPVLSAYVLRFANSPAFGISQTINSIPQATTMLGTRMVYAVVMDFAVSQRFTADLSPYGITSQELKTVSILQSKLTLRWLSKINKEYANFLAPLAFLMEIGKLVVADEIKKHRQEEVFRNEIKKRNSELRYEYDTVGATSYFISGMLFKHWKFDPIFVKIMKNLDFNYSKAFSKRLRFFKYALRVVRATVNFKEKLTIESIVRGGLVVQKMGLDETVFQKEAFRLRDSLE